MVMSRPPKRILLLESEIEVGRLYWCRTRKTRREIVPVRVDRVRAGGWQVTCQKTLRSIYIDSVGRFTDIVTPADYRHWNRLMLDAARDKQRKRAIPEPPKIGRQGNETTLDQT